MAKHDDSPSTLPSFDSPHNNNNNGIKKSRSSGYLSSLGSENGNSATDQNEVIRMTSMESSGVCSDDHGANKNPHFGRWLGFEDVDDNQQQAFACDGETIEKLDYSELNAGNDFEVNPPKSPKPGSRKPKMSKLRKLASHKNHSFH